MSILTELGLLFAVALAPSPERQHCWHTDYREATRVAKERPARLVLAFLPRSSQNTASVQLQAMTATARKTAAWQRHCFCRLFTDSKHESAGKQITLFEHPAFAALQGQPGMVIIDYEAESPFAGKVVSSVPFPAGGLLSARDFETLLQLPRASHTQRTLIYAVRTHPDAPRSADGVAAPRLLRECADHSHLQAGMQLQGHHRWEHRFHEITATLSSDQVAQEVCAESWPGQGMYAAAVECVRSWSRSPGHWEAVQRYHPEFGYDLKRGENGIWYATGIFARLRDD